MHLQAYLQLHVDLQIDFDWLLLADEAGLRLQCCKLSNKITELPNMACSTSIFKINKFLGCYHFGFRSCHMD